MDKWFKDILPDKDPYHNRGRDQMRKNSGIRVPVTDFNRSNMTENKRLYPTRQSTSPVKRLLVTDII